MQLEGGIVKHLFVAIAAFAPLVSAAQSASIPKAVVDSIASDLADLQSAVVAAQSRLDSSSSTNSFGASLPPTYRVPNVLGVEVTGAKPAVRAGASKGANKLLEPKRGEKFLVLDKADDWYAVKLPQPVEGHMTGWVNASDVIVEKAVDASLTGQVVATPSRAVAEDVFRMLTERAGRIRDAYKDNPYVSVSGFTVNVGVPPSVGVNFEFKK